MSYKEMGRAREGCGHGLQAWKHCTAEVEMGKFTLQKTELRSVCANSREANVSRAPAIPEHRLQNPADRNWAPDQEQLGEDTDHQMKT